MEKNGGQQASTRAQGGSHSYTLLHLKFLIKTVATNVMEKKTKLTIFCPNIRQPSQISLRRASLRQVALPYFRHLADLQGTVAHRPCMRSKLWRLGLGLLGAGLSSRQRPIVFWLQKYLAL